MNDNDARNRLMEEMIEHEIVSKEPGNLTYFHNGREYFVLLSVVDVTDWGKNSDPESDSDISN